jgi:adenylate kinase
MLFMKAKNDRAAWLQGPAGKCSVPPAPRARPYRMVLLGAPGVGKGTQAEMLCEHLGACHLSTGDVFRAVSNCGNCSAPPSPAMAEAVACMHCGKLVTDDIVLTMLVERTACLLCGGGFLLDGFPRTVAQARALEDLLTNQNLELNAVLDYQLPRKAILARLSGRRTCSICKAAFHVSSLPPKTAGVCDHCGGTLFQRDDDRPESIRVRLDAYAKNAGPLKKFYRRRHLLVPVAAAGTPEETFTRTLAALATHPGITTTHEPELLCG